MCIYILLKPWVYHFRVCLPCFSMCLFNTFVDGTHNKNSNKSRLLLYIRKRRPPFDFPELLANGNQHMMANGYLCLVTALSSSHCNKSHCCCALRVLTHHAHYTVYSRQEKHSISRLWLVLYFHGFYMSWPLYNSVLPLMTSHLFFFLSLFNYFRFFLDIDTHRKMFRLFHKRRHRMTPRATQKQNKRRTIYFVFFGFFVPMVLFMCVGYNMTCCDGRAYIVK